MGNRLTLIDRSYQLVEQLGEGGMGTVYRAVHLIDQQIVALKLVTPELDSSGLHQPSRVDREVELRLALAREFQTLASLHHPNVIRVQSYGFDGVHGSYFTMELLEGAHQILHAKPESSEAEQVLLVAQLLRALSYIHRRGVIHRDIKPGNVLVIDGEVKLLDFGIAAEASAYAEPAGTPEYMAPELLLGGEPSVASDLYAVGLLLHQMLMGKLPISLAMQSSLSLDHFASDEVSGSPTRAFTAAAVRDGTTQLGGGEPGFSLTAAFGNLDALDDLDNDAGELDIQIPGPLGDVVRQLVRRRPEERYRDAESVLRDLAAAVGVNIPIETAETRESFLQATVVVGRDAELELLRRRFADLKQGHGSAFLIGGESGVGKSRLIAELRTFALVYGCWVVDGQSVAEEGVYYQEWLSLLRALSLLVEVSDSEAAVLMPVVPDIAQRLGRTIPEPPVVKPEELQARLAATLNGLLARLSRPLLILLEDLHWARAETIALLNQINKNVKHLPVLIIGTYRSDERPGLPGQLPEMTPVPLARLGHAEIAQLSESMLGDIGKQPELIHYLEKQTEGNVFFLIEIVRALAEDVGGLQLIGQGTLPDSLLTTGIERIVERRVDRISPAYRPALEFAATLGRRLDIQTLEHAFPEISIRSLLLQCANAAVLESQGADWRFAHDKLRETILRRQSPAAQVKLHLQVAEALEATYSGEARDRICAQLAFHFASGQAPERAFAYYAQAGDRAAQFGLSAEARDHYRAALAQLAQLTDQPPRRRERIDLLLKLMRCALVSDSLDMQLERAQEAQELLDSLGSPESLDLEDRLRQVRIDYLTGRAYYYVGQTAEAIRRYQRVLPRAQEFGDAELTAMPSAVTGMALLVQGYSARSKQMLEQALEPLRQLGNDFEVVRCQEYLGLSLAFLGRYQEGLALLASAEARAKAMDQPQLLFIAKLLMTISHRSGMNWPLMLELIKPIGLAVEKAGDKTYGVIAWSLAAWAHAQLGQHQQALTERTRATELTREFNGKTLGADWFAASDSEMALLAGRYEDALRIGREIAESSRTSRLPLSWGVAERCWGGALAHLGAPVAEVDAHMEESLRAFALGDLVLDAAQTHIRWGKCCLIYGDTDGAARHFAEARTRLAAGGCDYALATLDAEVGELLSSR